ncbi:flagellar hook-associated protein FlgL [Hydrogenimonas cancrithermarum]|uniref:Flagellin n=1 Tax=Hydrogenimonas cancrithermarum TaxID=2993563 RepID=A0ABM8FLB1_9BACT|nr:flagellar hook-associated protein FlgL [Hydrogenimonas cancrithermarum]BDY12181.1 hypothetical protein HCR_04930 [Hydrogenimonas cancrithermarum]
MMRITQNNFFNTFVSDQQNIKEQLNRLNQQISSGMKIKYGYEDPSVFTDTLRLDYEEHTLTQAVDVATDAQNFANNTDSVMFQFTDALTRFKTLLIQAANSSNADSNYYAISNELKSLKEHLVNLGNSSINGRYLFSGSALDVKPLDEKGNYYGNGDSIKAVVGAEVEVPYNIPGEELFLGEDGNVSRKVTTNIPLARFDSQEPVTLDTTIEALTGNTDDYDFIIHGRKSDGAVFSDTVTLSSQKTVKDIMDAVANEYGSDLVNVGLVNGYINVTDKFQGSSLLDFHLFARSNTDPSNPTKRIEFIKSENVGADVYDRALFAKIDTSRFRANMPLTLVQDATNGTDAKKGEYAKTNTLLADLSTATSLEGKSVTLELNGTPTTIDIHDTTTIQNLLDTIDATINSPDARAVLDDQGRIVVENLNGSDTVTAFALYSDSTPPDLLFNTNDALTIDDPKHDLFAALDEAIEAVENGLLYPDGENLINPRNPGIENALARIDHVMEHVSKEHTKIGAMSNSLKYSVERSETLKINIQTLRSEVLDTDIGEATMKLNQLSLNFQAMLASIAKIQNISLVNYL